jgi:hypothetical protein
VPGLRLIRGIHDDPIYVIVSGERRHVPDPATFEYLNLRRRDVELMAQTEVDAIPMGPPLRSDAAKFHESSRRPRPRPSSGATSSDGRTRFLTPMSPFVLATVGLCLIIMASIAVWLAPPHLIPDGLTPADQATSVTAARTAIVQLSAAIIVLTGFYFTFETIRVSRLTQLAEQENNDATRYAEAVKLTSMSNSADVRVGGILALESLSTGSEAERGHVIRFLGTVLPVAGNTHASQRETVEIRAALDALRATRSEDALPLNLRGLTIKEMDQIELALGGCEIEASSFENCRFTSSWLTGVTLNESGWSNVDLRYSDLRGAVAWGAEIVESDLSWCNLAEANFMCADLRGTSFVGSQLDGTVFAGADLRGANLRSVNLKTSDLVGADISGAYADANTVWPPSVDPLARGVRMGVVT